MSELFNAELEQLNNLKLGKAAIWLESTRLIYIQEHWDRSYEEGVLGRFQFTVQIVKHVYDLVTGFIELSWVEF